MDTGIRVLHVDDDPDVSELARKFLEREDDRLTVEYVPDAEAGLERLADGEFECVVSDYEMPGMNGIEFLEAVREEYPDLPFVLFTGKGSEAVASDAISAGVTDYLQKGTGTEQFELLANRITNAMSQARTERQLAAERRRFQLLFERLSQPTVEVEYEGGEPIVQRVNPAFEETFGYAEDDIVGESLDAYIVPEEYEDEAEDINDRVREGGRLESEAVTRETADGRREFLLQNAAYADGSGGFAIYSDVTEREANERRLKQSLDLLRHTERLAGTGGWELDIETRDVHWTDGAYAVHGIDPDSGFDPTLSSILDLYHPDDRDRIQRTVAEIPRDDEPLAEELRLLPRDDGDKRRWVRVGGEPVTEDGEVVALRGAIEDITERKERERELQRHNDLFTRAQEIADIGAWEADLRTGEGWWTEQVARLYGLPPEYEPDIGEGIEYFHPDDRPVIRAAFERALEEGEPYDLELRLRGGDGVLRWVRVRGDPRFEDGEVVRVRGTMQDITERKERERELQRQNERLEEFASVVSHDLRNPLTVANGRLELARAENDSEDLAAVTEAHERMETLIGDLLTLARSGQQVDELEPVDLASVAESCYGNVETEGATLVVDTTTTIRADESRLQQLFENLFRNSVEHGSTSSRPSADDDPVTITAGDLEDGMGFYVADDGVGIPDDVRGQVFESGFSTSEAGTGFGLSIAREIAEAHGWELTVSESAEGGARFEVTGVETAP